MKTPVYLLCLLFFCLAGLPAGAVKNAKPFVVPELKDWKGAENRFLPGEKARIVCPEGADSLLAVGRRLAADYETMFGKKLPVVSGKGASGDYVLRISADRKLADEGYTLHITDRATLAAPTVRGLFWATRTLLQLSEQDPERQLPRGEARDYPDYPVRGFMIDCGRKFIPMSFLRDYVRIMAYYKMNTLQIHLNDNGFKQYFQHDWAKTYAAFRLESDTYPGLAAPDGHYTKQEFIALQEMADSLGVEIIPEIDVPAHSLAFTHYCPAIGSETYGMDHLDLFKPETYRFVDALFREYLSGEKPVFRGPRVHIGTDEYANEKQEVVEKFRAFTDHYIRLVESFGKQACVWGALTHARGETPVKSEHVWMSAWYNGYADPVEMMKQGYRLLSVPDGELYIVPAAGYYHDYLDTEALYRTWTPAHIGREVFPERHPQLAGGMFAVWNDHVGNGITPADIHYRAFPALQTLAVKMWTGPSTTWPYDAFSRLCAGLSEAPGVNVAGRVGREPGCVWAADKLQPETATGLKEIGHAYTVSFRIEGEAEPKGTELFRSPDAVFYLADPVTGKLGFMRDGYLNTFNYYVRPGCRDSVSIRGDRQSTALYIDGRLKEELGVERRWYNAGKDSMNYVRTLVFPLERSGSFHSRITGLKVYNYPL